MKSIRGFLMVALLATISSVTLVTTLVGYFEARHEMDELFDAQLAQYARTLNALIADNPTHLNLLIQRWRAQEHWDDQDDPATPLGHRYESKLAFQVWGEQGELLARSDNSPSYPFAPFEAGYQNIQHADHAWRVFLLYDLISRRWIITAERHDVRGELAQELTIEFMLPVLLGSPLAALLIWWSVGQGLRPLHRLRQQLAGRQADNLTPLEETHPTRELSPLYSTLNDLLWRLNASFERERRFASDAAHELRTPLAALNIHLENAIAIADESQRQALAPVTVASERLRHLIEQLLTLARTAPEQGIKPQTTTDLANLCRQQIGQHLGLARQRRQELSYHGADHCLIRGDGNWLSIALGNLLGNAIKYTQEGGEIELSTRCLPHEMVIEVRDNGPGIPVDQLNRVRERFYRAGGDRHASGVSGVGLGLSIVEHICRIHRARLSLQNREDRSGLIASIHFPMPFCSPDFE